jgi:hypothetical protein
MDNRDLKSNRRRLLLATLCATALPACTRSEWQEMPIREGGFSVLMRSQPNYARQQLDTPAGKVPAHLYSSPRGDSYFAVGYSDYPLAQIVGGSPEALFASVRDTWVKRIEGRLVGSSPLRLAKQYPGIEFSAEGTVKGAATFLDARLYLVDQRLYQVIAMGRKGEVQQGVVNRFLNSFKLIEASEGSTIMLKPPG